MERSDCDHRREEAVLFVRDKGTKHEKLMPYIQCLLCGRSRTPKASEFVKHILEREIYE